jgi:hypothetical protein
MTTIPAFRAGIALTAALLTTAPLFAQTTTLRLFTAETSTAELVQAPDGTIYGAKRPTTSSIFVNGQVFKLQPDGTGAQTLIAGFVVGGTGSKQVLTRAIGPSLTQFGVAGAVADPQLALFSSGGGQIAANAGWGGGAALGAAFTQVGAFALGATSRDSALLSPLAAGGYSAQVTSVSGGTGVALVEAYDADGAGSTTRFINLSARTLAGTGAQTLIAGFVLSGNVPRTLLIRGVGPGLNQFGVTGTLANPRLELHTTVNFRDTTVATNAGWGGSPHARRGVRASRRLRSPRHLLRRRAAHHAHPRRLHRASCGRRRHDRRGPRGGLRSAVKTCRAPLSSHRFSAAPLTRHSQSS